MDRTGLGWIVYFLLIKLGAASRGPRRFCTLCFGVSFNGVLWEQRLAGSGVPGRHSRGSFWGGGSARQTIPPDLVNISGENLLYSFCSHERFGVGKSCYFKIFFDIHSFRLMFLSPGPNCFTHFFQGSKRKEKVALLLERSKRGLKKVADIFPAAEHAGSAGPRPGQEAAYLGGS